MFSLVKLFYVLLLLLFFNEHAVANQNDFSGRWCWVRDSDFSTFTIIIKKVSNRYNGLYSAVAYLGDKIDDNDDAFSFKVPLSNTVQTNLNSVLDKYKGKIQLTLQSNNTLEWRILRALKEETYAPSMAILKRC